MLIRLALIVAFIGFLPSSAIVAQVFPKPSAADAASSDGPILGAPYSAKRHFISIEKKSDGTISRTETGGSEARDSQGREYSAGERLWTYFDGEKKVLKSEMLYRIEDPVANTTTKWDTGSKEVKVIEWPQSASVENASRMKCPGACDETETDQAGNVVEKLGTKTIGGFITEGTRVSYAVPAGRDKNNQPIVVVQESWYCPELKITIVEIYDDPRNGTSSNELIDIVRGEPDATQYEAPADYPVRKVQMHLQ